jgi:tetratricopeptide (TPR) repeat protein
MCPPRHHQFLLLVLRIMFLPVLLLSHTARADLASTVRPKDGDARSNGTRRSPSPLSSAEQKGPSHFQDDEQVIGSREAETLQHQQRAQAFFMTGDFGNAANEFLAAYQITPLSKYLFSAAQSYRKAQDTEQAISYYERFVNQSRDNPDFRRLRDEANGYLQSLYVIRDKEALLRRPVWKKKWFWGVLAGGAALAATTVIIGVVLGTRDQRETLQF